MRRSIKNFLFLSFFCCCRPALATEQSSELLSRLGGLLESEDYYDFTIVSSDDVPIKCHKAVLESEAIFARLLNANMAEASASVAYIDFPAKTLKIVLSYLYGKKASVATVDEYWQTLELAQYLGSEKILQQLDRHISAKYRQLIEALSQGVSAGQESPSHFRASLFSFLELASRYKLSRSLYEISILLLKIEISAEGKRFISTILNFHPRALR